MQFIKKDIKNIGRTMPKKIGFGMAYCFWTPCNKASFEIVIFVIRLSLARA